MSAYDPPEPSDETYADYWEATRGDTCECANAYECDGRSLLEGCYQLQQEAAQDATNGDLSATEKPDDA